MMVARWHARWLLRLLEELSKDDLKIQLMVLVLSSRARMHGRSDVVD
jgi:hypothetical protein